MSIVTLSTDFGYADFIVGALKGQLITLNPDFSIVDISHYLSAKNYFYSAYICRNAFVHFPEQSIHIVLIDIFNSTPTHLLVAEHKKHYFVVPDNGIITMILNDKIEQIVKFDLRKNITTTTEITLEAAKIATELAKGKYIRQLGKEVEEMREIYPMRAAIGKDSIEGQIVFIDKNENAIINIMKEEFEEAKKDRTFRILLPNNEKITRISDNYSMAQSGNLVAWFNSAGFLEIAIKNGGLAGLFGLQDISASEAKHKKMYETIRIFFDNKDM